MTDPSGEGDESCTALPCPKVVKKSCYPRWNETFEFDLDKSATEKLCIEVWDWDLVSRNDFLGKVRGHRRLIRATSFGLVLIQSVGLIFNKLHGSDTGL